MIHVLPVKGVFLTYCYFLIDDETKHGFLFDVGAQGKKFAAIIKQNGWTIEKIFLTHAHFDHTGGLDELRQHLDIPVYAHNNAQKLLESPELNLSRYCCEDILTMLPTSAEYSPVAADYDLENRIAPKHNLYYLKNAVFQLHLCDNCSSCHRREDIINALDRRQYPYRHCRVAV